VGADLSVGVVIDGPQLDDILDEAEVPLDIAGGWRAGPDGLGLTAHQETANLGSSETRVTPSLMAFVRRIAVSGQRLF
jgi:hypothetical protein